MKVSGCTEVGVKNADGPEASVPESSAAVHGLVGFPAATNKILVSFGSSAVGGLGVKVMVRRGRVFGFIKGVPCRKGGGYMLNVVKGNAALTLGIRR